MTILYYLEQIRTDWLNQLCIYFSMLGEETLFVIVGVTLLWCIDKKWGYRYFFIGSMATAFCRLIKGATQVPRPFERDSEFSYVTAAEKKAPGYSMPSGHCQGATNTFGTNAYRKRGRLFRIIMMIPILLVAFARMELGVHTFWDCLVGISVALAVTIVYARLFDWADGNVRKLILITIASFGVMILIVIILAFIPQSENFRPDVNLKCMKRTWAAAGTMLGVGGGYLIDRFKVHYQTKAPIWVQIVKVVVGAVLMVLMQKVSGMVLDAVFPELMVADGIQNFLIMFIFTGIYPMTFRWR